MSPEEHAGLLVDAQHAGATSDPSALVDVLVGLVVGDGVDISPAQLRSVLALYDRAADH